MIILRFIIVFFLFMNIISAYADQIDIGIFESSTIPGQIDIKIRPDFDIVEPQTITALLYTVRWDDPSIAITTQYIYPFFLAPQGEPEEYNGYYYQVFAAVPGNSIPMNANDEYIASSFTYTNGDCATFEIIEDEWTQANNGNLYLEFIGANLTGIIYNPSVNLGSIGGNIQGNDTIYIGNSTGPMDLSSYQGDVLSWQRKIDENPWTGIPGTSGLITYSETPLTLGSYSYRAEVQNVSCPEVFSEILSIQVVEHEDIELSLKVFLEGGFLISEMGTILNQSNIIPLTQPYSSAPWNYPGTESVTLIPNTDVADWVLIELRETSGDPSTATSSTKVASQAGFLLKDGMVVGMDGINNLLLDVVPKNDLYVVVWHRNHLSVMSSAPLTPTGDIYSYDFTNGATKAYEVSGFGHKEIYTGVWAMMGGDQNADGNINNDDLIEWKNNAGMKGYNSSDFTMDSQTNNLDKNDIWYWNYGSESQVPD